MAKIKATGTGTGSGSVKKSTKGIPRITDKVLAMDQAGRDAWMKEKCGALPADVQAEISARMAELIANGRKSTGKSKVTDFVKLFTGRTVAELTSAQSALTDALAESAKTEEDNLNRIIAKAQAEKDALVKARTAKAGVSA